MNNEKDIITPTIYGGNMTADVNGTVCSSAIGSAGGEELTAGDVFDSKYVILSRIGGKTSQAQVYTATNEETAETIVLKVYSVDFKPDYAKLEKIKKIDSPYLAKMIEYDNCNGRHYETYVYYKNGNLRDRLKEKPLTEEFVEKIAIPSLNEALNILHEQRIAHADVKPENIFLSDDEQALVLGDYGISVSLGKEGYAFAEIQGTLAYAPRFEQHFSKAKIDTAYDYGAMGLVLIALLCGKGLFDGMDNDEIFVELQKGIEIPSNITGRMRTLIAALTDNEPEERLGYIEIVRWCEGDIVKGKFKKKNDRPKNIESLIVAIVDGKVINVNSPVDFANEILKNWNAARERIFENPNARTILKSFLGQFEGEYYQAVSKYLDYIDKDKMLFCVAYTIYPQKAIYYKGRKLGSIDDLINALHTKEDNEIFINFIKSDVLEFYMEVNEFDKQLSDSINELIAISDGDSEFLYYLILHSFAKEKALKMGEKIIKNFDDLSDVVIEQGLDWIMSGDNINNLYAWLYCQGFGREVEMMRKRDKN